VTDRNLKFLKVAGWDLDPARRTLWRGRPLFGSFGGHDGWIGIIEQGFRGKGKRRVRDIYLEAAEETPLAHLLSQHEYIPISNGSIVPPT
jgi:hypothetical protein